MSDWTYLPLGAVTPEQLVRAAVSAVDALERHVYTVKVAKGSTPLAPSETTQTSPVPNRPTPTTGKPSWESSGDLSMYVQKATQQLQQALGATSKALTAIQPVQQQYHQLRTQAVQQFKRIRDTISHLQQNFADNPLVRRIGQWWGNVTSSMDFQRADPKQTAAVLQQAAASFNKFVNFRGSFTSDNRQWNAGEKMFPGAGKLPMGNGPFGQMDPGSGVRGKGPGVVPPQVRQGVENELAARAGVVVNGRFFKSANDEGAWCWKLG